MLILRKTSSKLSLIIAAISLSCFGIAPSQAQTDDIALYSIALDMCQISPGFALLGYPNEAVCIEGVYLDLLNSQGSNGGGSPFVPDGTPGDFGGCAGSRICES